MSAAPKHNSWYLASKDVLSALKVSESRKVTISPRFWMPNKRTKHELIIGN